MKRVFRYLKGTLQHGIHIKPSHYQYLIGFIDAYWVGCLDDRRSVGGYYVFYGDTLVAWLSRKQRMMARLSTKSKIRSLANLAAELAWIESMLKEIGFP